VDRAKFECSCTSEDSEDKHISELLGHISDQLDFLIYLKQKEEK